MRPQLTSGVRQVAPPEVSESKVASETGKILQNDWTRGFVLLTGAVPIALCMACDIMLYYILLCYVI